MQYRKHNYLVLYRSEILIEKQLISHKKLNLKISDEWRPWGNVVVFAMRIVPKTNWPKRMLLYMVLFKIIEILQSNTSELIGYQTYIMCWMQ